MAKRFPLLLIAMLIMGFTVAGCGDDDKKSSDSKSSDTTAQTETTEAPADTATEDTGSDTDTTAETPNTPDVSNEPQVKQAVAQCKKSVNAAPQLKPDTKKKLESICEKAAKGDQSGIKEASKEVCLAIINDTGITGSAADTAKQQCEAISK